MIAHLRGRLVAVDAAGCIIDVAGVGYACQASRRCLESMGSIGDEVEVLVDTAISVGDKRSGSIVLTAFLGAKQKHMWHMLQTVQGVGGKAALAILSALAVDDLLLAIAAKDKSMIARAEGVGGKLALRIIHELADKVGGMEITAAGLPAGEAAVVGDGVLAEAISALVNLGYSRAEAHKTINHIASSSFNADADSPPSLEALVSAALAYLGQASTSGEKAS